MNNDVRAAELEQVDLPAVTDQEITAEAVPGTMLGLRLSFYDKQPQSAGAEAVDADPESEPVSLQDAPN